MGSKAWYASPNLPFDIELAQVIGETVLKCTADWAVVKTNAGQWDYVLSVPVRETGNGSVERVCVEIELHIGRLGLGTLTDGGHFYDIVDLPQELGKRQTINLRIPPLKHRGPLILRNAGEGPLAVRFRFSGRSGGDVERRPNDAVIWLEKAISDLNSAAAVLGETHPPEVLHLMRPAVRASAHAALGLLKYSLIDLLKPDDFIGLDRVPPDVLKHLAEAVAITPRIGFTPNWKFDACRFSADLSTVLRLKLWEILRHKYPEMEIVAPWLEGSKIKFPCGSDLSLAVFGGGNFEPNEFAVLDSVLVEGMHVMDIGANEGVYSIYASQRVGSSGKVVAIEPSLRESRRLRANMLLNRSRNIAVLECAIVDQVGWVEFTVAEASHAGLNALADFYDESNPAQDRHLTRAATLDSVARQSLGLKVDVIKIDVEGAESAVLRSGLVTLADARPIILVEIARKELDVNRDALTLLKEQNYNVYSIDNRLGCVMPLESARTVANVVAIPFERPDLKRKIGVH